MNAANFTATQSGDWDKGATWGNAGINIAGITYPGLFDNATITSGKNVQVKQSQSVTNLTINSGGVLTNSNNKDLLVVGNYVLNGIHTGGTGSTVTFFATGKSISGIGTMDLAGGADIYFSISILSAANLNIATDLRLSAGVTVTNNGKVTMVAPATISASAAGPVWVNAANSFLSPGASTNVLSNVTLNASATGNTVNYYQTPAQNIKTPSSNTYYNLILSGVGTKSMVSNLTVLGNINISATTFSMSSYVLTLQGNWVNEGVLSGTGTVIFTGTNAQSITNSSGEVFYNMTNSKSSGYLTLMNDVSVSNTLALNSGQIDANLQVLTIGTSTSSIGTLNYTAGFIFNGYVKRWVNATGVSYLFPMGIQYGSYYAPLKITFNSFTSTGALMVRFPPIPGTTNNGLPLSDNGVMVYNTFGQGIYMLTPLNGLASSNYNAEAVGLPFFNYYASTRILARPNSSSNWVANGVHQPGVPGTGPAKRANLTILPVELTLADTVNCTAPVTTSFTGPRNVCINSTQNYSVPNTGNSFLWVVQGGTQISGGNTNSISVKWGNAGTTGVLIVIEQSACGSGIPAYDFITMSPTTLTSITGKDYAPENTTVGNEETYSIDPQPGYTYSWSISGGTIITGAATSSITVRWGAAGAGQVTASITNGCGTSTLVKPVNIYVVINSIKSGSWDDPTTWDCNCVPASYNSVRVRNPHVVTFPNSDIVINNLIADIGGTFNNTTNKTLTVNRDLLIDGTYTGTNELILNGTGTIDGIGTISTSGNLTLTGGDKTILTSCVLLRTSGDVFIKSGINVLNNGIFTTTRNINGETTSSTWTNNSNSVLNIWGSFLTTGTAVVDNVPNLVEYRGSASQNIKLTDYYDLSSTGSGARVLPSSGVVGVAGDFNPGTNAFTITGSTVNFNGTDQNIGAFTFNNLTVSGGGTKTLTGDVTHNGVLTLTNGIISTGSNVLIAPSTATVSRTSGHVNGNYRKWISNTSAKTFEVGTATDYTPMAVTFASVTTAGYITASVFAGDHPSIASTCLDPNKSVNLYFGLTNNSLTAGTFSVTFNYLPSHLDAGYNLSKFGIQVYNGSTWSAPLTLNGVPTSTQAQITGVSTFGAFEIAESCLYTWTGTTSTAWNVGENWSSGNIPTSTNDVLIPSSVPSGNMPLITASSISRILANNGIITFGASGVLNIYGNVTNTGTITAVSGSTINMTGAAAQTITGLPTAYNITVNNAAGVTIASAAASKLTVKGKLSLTTGTLTTNGNLTIDIDNGGSIGYASGDLGTVSGNVTVFRGINSITTHYISCPLDGVDVNGLTDDAQVINPTTTKSRLFQFDNTAYKWNAITNLSTAMAPGSCFSMWFPATTSVDFTGTYNHAATYSYSSPNVATKFMFVSNPYPSTLDWDASAGWTKDGVNNAVYFWNPTTNSYTSYVNGQGTNSATKYIPAMNSFFVAYNGTTPSTATVAMDGRVRTSTFQAMWRTAVDETIRLTLKNATSADEAVIRFNENATNDFDGDFDAYKMMNAASVPSIYTAFGSINYSINSISDAYAKDTIAVFTKIPADGDYVLSIVSSDPSIEYVLVDKKLGTQTVVTTKDYAFTALKTDSLNRFDLQLRQTTTGMKNGNSTSNITILSSPNGFLVKSNLTGTGTIEILDASGNRVQVLSNVSISNGNNFFAPEIAAGLYLIKVNMAQTSYIDQVSIIK